MGASDFTSGGGMTARHPLAPAGSRRLVASTSMDGLNTIRIPLVPVACWRLNDPAFDFDSSFVLPRFRDEIVGTDARRGLAALLGDNTDCPAALFAHADPVGSDAVNKTISDRRAIAIYA